jgi:hypothetical protein
MSELSEVVARFTYRHDAELAQGFLADAGIESVLVTDDAGGAMAGLGFTQPRIIVRADDVEAARTALREAGVLEDDDES